jgi:hypothetical protein
VLRGSAGAQNVVNQRSSPENVGKGHGRGPVEEQLYAVGEDADEAGLANLGNFLEPDFLLCSAEIVHEAQVVGGKEQSPGDHERGASEGRDEDLAFGEVEQPTELFVLPFLRTRTRP